VVRLVSLNWDGGAHPLHRLLDGDAPAGLGVEGRDHGGQDGGRHPTTFRAPAALKSTGRRFDSGAACTIEIAFIPIPRSSGRDRAARDWSPSSTSTPAAALARSTPISFRSLCRSLRRCDGNFSAFIAVICKSPVGLRNRRSLVRIQSGASLCVPLRAALFPVQSQTYGSATDQRSGGCLSFPGRSGA
jgi:hypothetical protein